MALTDARSASDVAGDGGGGGDEKDCTGGPGVWVGAIVGGGSSAQYIWRCPSAAHQDLAELCRSGVGAVQVFQTSRLILERLRAASPFEMHTRSWPVSFVFIRKLSCSRMYPDASSAAVDGSVAKMRRPDAAAAAHDIRMHSSA